MEPIRVPAPPKAAFNKQRPMSDLIKAQIKHFKHLEHKLPAESRAALPQHAIVSEADAARYIAPMTALLRSRGAATPPAAKPTAQIASLPRRTRGLSIAATAEAVTPVRKAKKKSSTKQKARSRPSKRTK
jgi:hypothetical protein